MSEVPNPEVVELARQREVVGQATGTIRFYNPAGWVIHEQEATFDEYGDGRYVLAESVTVDGPAHVFAIGVIPPGSHDEHIEPVSEAIVIDDGSFGTVNVDATTPGVAKAENVDWRQMFVRYVEVVMTEEGLDFLDSPWSDWTDQERAAIEEATRRETKQ